MSDQSPAEFNPTSTVDALRLLGQEGIGAINMLDSLDLTEPQKNAVLEVLAKIEDAEVSAASNQVTDALQHTHIVNPNQNIDASNPSNISGAVVVNQTVNSDDDRLRNVQPVSAIPASLPVAQPTNTSRSQPVQTAPLPVDIQLAAPDTQPEPVATPANTENNDDFVVERLRAQITPEQQADLKSRILAKLQANGTLVDTALDGIIGVSGIPDALKPFARQSKRQFLDWLGITNNIVTDPEAQTAATTEASTPQDAEQFAKLVKQKLERGPAASVLDDNIIGLPKYMNDRIRGIFNKHIDIAKAQNGLRSTQVEIDRWKIFEDKSDYLDLKMKLFKNNLFKTLAGSAGTAIGLAFTLGTLPATLPAFLFIIAGGSAVYGINALKEYTHPSKDFAKLNRVGLEIKKMNDELDLAKDKNKLAAKESIMQLIRDAVDMSLVGRSADFREAAKNELAKGTLPDYSALAAVQSQLNSAYK